MTISVPDHSLLRPIASGSYGEVWLARNAVGTLRAVKIVRRDRLERAEDLEREFRGLQNFEPVSRSHEGLVDILSLGLLPDGAGFYYVMELADDAFVAADVRRLTLQKSQIKSEPPHVGCYKPRTLRAELKSRGALTADEVITLGLKLTAALAHLHAHGLVHRDVKPSNILFIGGELKLADAGLVAAVDDARSLVGTAGYIAPEGPGTPQADLYALGKVLYEAAFGKDRQEFPALPADVASRPDHARLLELNAILLKACATDRRERYQSADEMRADLELLHAGRSVKHRQAWRRRARAALMTGFTAAAIAALAWLLAPRFGSSPPFPVLAVLPFDADAAAPGDDLAARMSEEVRGSLTRVPRLGVIGRGSSEELKQSGQALALARSNGISAVLEGRVHRQGEKFSLSLELTDTRSGRLLWSMPPSEGAVSNRFGFQLRVVQEIPDALKLKLTESDRVKLAVQPTRSLPALEAYWEGRHVWESWDKPGRMEKAMQLFQTAVREDPGFAAAYAEIVNCYVGFAQGRPWKQYRDDARIAARKALALAPDLADAHIASAFIKWGDYDWRGAESDFRRALQLNPLHARGCVWFAAFFEESGRFEEAGKFRRSAVELDPLSDFAAAHVANQLVREGRLEEALAQYENAGRSPRDSGMQWPIAETLRALKRDAAALDAYERALLSWNVSRDDLAALRSGFQRNGWTGYWQVRLQQIGPDASSFERARLNALAGHTNEVFALLQQSVADYEAPAPRIIYDDAFKSYRADPRFNELLRKMNLDEPGVSRPERAVGRRREPSRTPGN